MSDSSWLPLKESLNLKLRPIEQWPGKLRGSSSREDSPYSAPLKDTLKVLKRELAALNAREIILQIAIREGHFRQDGLPYAKAMAEHPGVILSFQSKHGPMRLFFDRFSLYEYNLRAIALHLEHLRLAGLYGVGEDGQQYKGWQALPPPAPHSAMTVEDSDREVSAARFIAQYGGFKEADVYLNKLAFQNAYRVAAHKLHPDRGGSQELMTRLNEAIAVLKARHGI